MSSVDVLRPGSMPPEQEIHTVRQTVGWRLPVLVLLMLVCIAWNVELRVTAPVVDTPVAGFLLSWSGSFIPYICACLIVLFTPAPTGRQRWVEVGCILLGALVLRVLFVPVPPNLTGDFWRYLWDARVTVHGFSPYVYVPDDPALVPLRTFYYARMGYHTVPTLYPPGAQAVYLLSYMLAPDNMVMLKSFLVVFEMVSCVGLVLLLRAYGMDMSRCIVYAWCPLPIMEFILQGHNEAIAVAFTVLALLCATGNGRGRNVLTGVFIGLAMLANLYPILVLLVMVYRRSWSWLLTCAVTTVVTIVIGYLPYVIFGQGRVLGFFNTFVSERTSNAGPLMLATRWVCEQLLHVGPALTLQIEYAVDLLAVVGVALTVVWLCWRGRMQPPDAVLVLIATIFSASSHINTWYTAALVPWVVFMVGPLWTRGGGWNARGWVGWTALYFSCSSVIWYYFFLAKSLAPYFQDIRNYYVVVYDVPFVLLGLLVVLSGWQRWFRRKLG